MVHVLPGEGGVPSIRKEDIMTKTVKELMVIHALGRRSPRVDAVRVTEENVRQVAEWCGGTAYSMLTPHVWLTNGFGDGLRAYAGDWVVRNKEGEFGVANHEVFMAEYVMEGQDADRR